MTIPVRPYLHRAVLALSAVASTLSAVASAHARPASTGTAAWLLENYPRAAVPSYPQTIAISGCTLTVTQRPDRKTDVVTQVDLRRAQISRYAGPGRAHVDFLTAGVFPVRFRFADGSASTGATAVAGLVTRRGDQALRIASAFDRLRASCARSPSR